MKAYSCGSGIDPGQVEDGVLAELLERELHGEDRAEGVAVGVLVGRDEEPVVRPDRARRPRRGQVVWVSVWGKLIDEPG